MDLFWLKTLANSRYDQGSWQLDDPIEIRNHNRTAVAKTMEAIYQEMVLSVNAFNNYVQPDKFMGTLPIYCQVRHQMKGCVIMHKNIKIRLERYGTKIDAILISTRGYSQHRETIHQFTAKMDPLGGLIWIMDDKSVMSIEMIVKQLLYDLWSTAHEERSHKDIKMRIFFKDSDPYLIVEKLKTAMGGRALSKIVNFDIQGKQLVVTLSKLGKSTLFFDQTAGTGGITYELAKEKIALAHKALKGEVTQKIVKVVEKAGGIVS